MPKRRSFLLAVLLSLAACGGAGDRGTAPPEIGNGQARADDRAPPAAAPGSGRPEVSAAAPAPQPLAAIPEPFHGTWEANQAACATGPTELRLTVSGSELRFHESIATVTSIEEDGDSVSIAAGFEGEGERWARDLRLRLSADGQSLTVDIAGTGTTRVRCS